jgi:hypothetical protein
MVPYSRTCAFPALRDKDQILDHDNQITRQSTVSAPVAPDKNQDHTVRLAD